jgi:hypothetical protein
MGDGTCIEHSEEEDEEDEAAETSSMLKAYTGIFLAATWLEKSWPAEVKYRENEKSRVERQQSLDPLLPFLHVAQSSTAGAAIMPSNERPNDFVLAYAGNGIVVALGSPRELIQFGPVDLERRPGGQIMDFCWDRKELDLRRECRGSR